MADGLDIALVSLGTTPGLRSADEAFAGMARRAGLSCELVHVDLGGAARLRRQTTVTDVIEARAARRAAAGVDARVVVYSTVTAALLRPQRGRYAVRFDSTAAANRPGIAGIWSRRREAKALAGATLLLPWGDAAAKTIPDAARAVPALPLRVPVEAVAADLRDIDALAYAGYPLKRGLDILLRAWEASGLARERVLQVTGVEPERALRWLRRRRVEVPPGVEWTGLLDAQEFRARLGRARIFVNASRREDHGLSQLEALSAGAALVTVSSAGPYEALPLATRLDARLVAPGVDAGALATALRAGFEIDLGTYAARATELLRPYRRDEIERVFADRVVPALGLR